MHSYTQLTESERNQSYALKQAGFKPSAIALQLSRHPSTIYRELRRNRGLRGYRPRQAQQMADNRRREKVKPSSRAMLRENRPFGRMRMLSLHYEKTNMEKKAVQCQRCGSSVIVKNGSNANGKKKFLCKDCSRQFVENPQNKTISDAEWRIVDKLLVERISLAGIASAVSISKRWLQKYVKKKTK